MVRPYRTPGVIRDETGEPVSDRALGRLRSSHGRAVAGIVAIAFGRRSAVDVHENGLAILDMIGRRSEVMFSDVDAIHYEAVGLLRGALRLTLVTFAGVRVGIPSDIAALDVVVDAIDRAVTTPTVARVTVALQRGERLDFGPLVLTLDGIVLNGEPLPWSELAYVTAEPDVLVFHARGPRGRFGWTGIAKVPHPRALLEALGLRTNVLMRGLRLGGTRR